MAKHNHKPETDPAAPPSLSAEPHPEAASQTVTEAAGPRVVLRRHIGKDGVKLRQHEIYVLRGPLDGAQEVRVGYAGHPPAGGVALIGYVDADERKAVLAAVEKLFKAAPSKVVSAPGIGDLTGVEFTEISEDEFEFNGERDE